ncbi:Protein of unknown function [Kaistia soli DSM 19436]|uniref:DUF3102 domain-containing protein n=1 Tax=Kaistia soli DSM 19436 TaxID=1122133 RepID=A0A1M4YF24_9HYPH|nr:DUF3102 domain-containing protein [Kaistia soli]SHF04384.1 Protein of unknown function [Kaistia soli DSM 19436]
MNQVATFDYHSLGLDDTGSIREAAARIRLRMQRSASDIIEIGRDLHFVKAELGHGKFLAWIEAEFGMSRQSAERFMAVADRFGAKMLTLGNLPVTALYELAAPSTPDDVVEDVLARAGEGDPTSAVEIKRLKKELAKTLGDAAEAEARAARATGTAERARADAQQAWADMASFKKQAEALAENAELVRVQARAEAEVAAKAEIERLAGEIEKVRAEAAAAAEAQGAAAARAALAEVAEDVREARRKEAEAKASADRLRGIEEALRKSVETHRAFLSAQENSDVEARNLLDQLGDFDQTMTRLAVVIEGLEYQHSGKVAGIAHGVAERCGRLAQMIASIGSARMTFDADVTDLDGAKS